MCWCRHYYVIKHKLPIFFICLIRPRKQMQLKFHVGWWIILLRHYNSNLQSPLHPLQFQHRSDYALCWKTDQNISLLLIRSQFKCVFYKKYIGSQKNDSRMLSLPFFNCVSKAFINTNLKQEFSSDVFFKGSTKLRPLSVNCTKSAKIGLINQYYCLVISFVRFKIIFCSVFFTFLYIFY